jgi:DNA-binding MarR family transcriptional regulator
MHLRRGDEGNLSEHERQLLHHIPAQAPGVPLGTVARHLALPSSSASVLVKDLARRGFIARRRDPRDERRLSLVLTRRGAARVAADSVLDPKRLTAALQALGATERLALVAALEQVGEAGAALPAAAPRRRRRARSTP